MVAAEQAKQQIPDFHPGDTVRVHIKVVEGDSERVQVFEGTCLGRRGHGDGASFLVRKTSFGVGVERTFPLISPHIAKVEIVKSGRVRRAKLYYLRELSGRAARLDERVTPEAEAGAHAKSPAAAPAKAPAHEDSNGQAKDKAAVTVDVASVKTASTAK